MRYYASFLNITSVIAHAAWSSRTSRLSEQVGTDVAKGAQGGHAAPRWSANKKEGKWFFSANTYNIILLPLPLQLGLHLMCKNCHFDTQNFQKSPL